MIAHPPECEDDAITLPIVAPPRQDCHVLHDPIQRQLRNNLQACSLKLLARLMRLHIPASRQLHIMQRLFVQPCIGYPRSKTIHLECVQYGLKWQQVLSCWFT